MKATGIVRRIDDLGRVVIPKEIRRTLRIREGDPLEIFTGNGGEVVFKKYSPMGEMATIAGDFCAAIAKNTALCVAICDREHCIAAEGPCKKELLEQPLSPELVLLAEHRKIFEGDSKIFCVSDSEKTVAAMMPIIAAGDIIGSVCLVKCDSEQSATESDFKLIQTAASFLGSRAE